MRAIAFGLAELLYCECLLVFGQLKPIRSSGFVLVGREGGEGGAGFGCWSVLHSVVWLCPLALQAPAHAVGNLHGMIWTLRIH
jgi:hypothetical protein